MSSKSFAVRIPVSSRDTVKALNDIQKKQLPFAIAQALTWTAKDVAKDEAKATAVHFDMPTPFTRKAFAITPATKRNLVAYVFIKDHQWKYLKYQVDGGVRSPKGRAIPIPTSNLTDRNRFGNMRKTQLRQLLRHPDTFSGVVKGVGGIWHRTARGNVQLLVAWEPRAHYRKQFPFVRIASRSSNRHYPRRFKSSLRAALRSAR